MSFTIVQFINKKVDAALQSQGVTLPLIRRVCHAMVWLCLTALFVGLVFLPKSLMPMWAAAAATLVSWSFFSMASFVEHSMMQPGIKHQKMTRGQILRYALRLFVMTAFIFAALWANVNNATVLAVGITLPGVVALLVIFCYKEK